MTVLPLFLAGIVAGMLTTVAGLGGGILLIAGLNLFWDPAVVLAVTAPALFLGNVSRVLLLRQALQGRVLATFALTAVPLAFAGSLVATQLPAHVLRLVVGVFLLAFIAHELRPKAATPAARPRLALLAGGGAVAGLVSGITGGAGFIAAPFLMRYGLTKTELVATSSAGMGLIHLAKMAGFGLTGLMSVALLPACAVLAAGIMAGNAVGGRLLDRLSPAVFRRCLLTGLGLAGVHLLVAGG